MGEVYRARDPELDRDVAVKVLRSDVGDDADRVRRMEREARAVGRLNHPNLLAIHDIGRYQGTPYLVCELLEGSTLRERMAKGRLPPGDVLAYGAQIAAGLAAAHEEGVVHRDVKPENLWVTREGRVKILDFGLAKLTGAGTAESSAPTMTAATALGSVLGTVAYMSPEQAAGHRADHRSDQFAFGTILYEMLTGRHPFERETAPETMTAILKDEPEPLAHLASSTPAPLRWMVERCLSKDPTRRYVSTSDLARDLRVLADRVGELACEDGPAQRPRRAVMAIALTAILLAAVTGFVAFLAGRQVAEVPSLQFERLTFRRGTVTAARFDPDGESVLYSAAWEGEPSRLYLKRPGTAEPIPIGPPDSILLAVSSQGELLLTTGHRAVGPFYRTGTLARMPVAGTPRVLEEEILEAAWDADGELVALVREEGHQVILEYPPGRRRRATGGMFWGLRASPDGESVAFVELRQRGSNRGSVVIVQADGGERRLGLGGDLQGLAWSPSGDEIWFARDGSIIAADTEGEERVVATLPQRVVLHDIAPDGRVLLAVEPARWEMAGKPSGGAREQDLSWLSWSIPFDISADGSTVLFNECPEANSCTVCLRGFDDEPPVLLGAGFGMALSPDGDRVLSILPWEPSALTLIPTGPGERQTFTLAASGIERANVGIWLPNGEEILLSADTAEESNRLFRFDPATGLAAAITSEGLRYGFFAVSPDGESVAVQLAAGGTVVYPLEGGDGVPVPGLDEQPIRWSADGRFLFTYRFGQMPMEVLRVEVATGATETFASLAPAEAAGVVEISPLAVAPEGGAYVYGYLRHLSELLVVKGME